MLICAPWISSHCISKAVPTSISCTRAGLVCLSLHVYIYYINTSTVLVLFITACKGSDSSWGSKYRARGKVIESFRINTCFEGYTLTFCFWVGNCSEHLCTCNNLFSDITQCAIITCNKTVHSKLKHLYLYVSIFTIQGCVIFSLTCVWLYVPEWSFSSPYCRCCWRLVEIR